MCDCAMITEPPSASTREPRRTITHALTLDLDRYIFFNRAQYLMVPPRTAMVCRSRHATCSRSPTEPLGRALGRVARLDLRLGHRVQQQVIGARVVVLRATRPVVRHGVREDGTCARAGTRVSRRCVCDRDRICGVGPIAPSWLKAPTGMGRQAFWKALSLCRESLSQKLKVPSPPVVANVPNFGWNAMQFTA